MNLVQSKLESTKFNLVHICLGQGFLEFGAILVKLGIGAIINKGAKAGQLKKVEIYTG